MKLCLFLCAATALASDIIRPDAQTNLAAHNPNSARIGTYKPDHIFSPHGHAGDLSSHVGGTAGAGAAWERTPRSKGDANGTLMNCNAGKYEAFTLAGLRACFACPLGKFQPQPDQTHCDDCPKDTEGHQYGQALESNACRQCPGGQHQPRKGQSFCLTDAQTTQVCPAGHVKKGNGCSPCGPGKYYTGVWQRDLEVGSKCYDCPSNHYMPHSGAGACLLCAAGKFNDRSGATYCMWRGKTDILPPRPPDPVVTCPKGKFFHEVAPYIARRNHAAGANETRCGADNSGNPTCATCEFCPAGKYSDNPTCTTGNCCKNCPAGKFNPWSGKGALGMDAACLYCAGAGGVAPAGSSRCEFLNRSTATHAALPSCPVGKFRVLSNQKLATSLNIGGNGYLADNPSANLEASCAPCAVGRFRAAGSSDLNCNTCPPGQEATRSDRNDGTSEFDYAMVSARLCNDTDYSNGGNTTDGGVTDYDTNVCQTDDRETRHWMEGADRCTPCKAGYAWQAGMCKKCPAGTHQHITGSFECIPCRDGTWSAPGSEWCTVKAASEHCTNGRIWNATGKPCTRTCDNREPFCPAQTVARCECPQSAPYWDDRVQVCRDLPYCEAQANPASCPEGANPWTDDGTKSTTFQTWISANCDGIKSTYTLRYNRQHSSSKTFEWLTSTNYHTEGGYDKIKLRNGCLQHPCGVLKPVSGCFSPKWHKEYDEGWSGNGENEDWCKTYTCSSGELTPVNPDKKCDLAPTCSHLRCKFVAGAVKVKYDKLESVGVKHRCGHLDDNDPNHCVCTCYA